jgi:hypothetical protein
MKEKGRSLMRTLGKIAATLGVVGATAMVGMIPASAFAIYVGPRHHHRYYDYYGGHYPGADPNGCPRGYSLQGGNCAPYKGPYGHGPWDWYR